MLSNKYPGYSFTDEKTQILFNLLENIKQRFDTISHTIISMYPQHSAERTRLLKELIEIEFCFIESLIDEIERGKKDTFYSMDALHEKLDKFERAISY